MSKLSLVEIRQQLKGVPDWSRCAGGIQRTFPCGSFLRSLEFVRRVGRLAEKCDHHPDIDIRFDKVTLILVTHDQGGITGKDFALARHCDELFAKVV